eukprot:571718-Hanusia_phi.AAC.1
MEGQWKRNLEILAIPEHETESIIVHGWHSQEDIGSAAQAAVVWIARKRGAGPGGSLGPRSHTVTRESQGGRNLAE